MKLIILVAVDDAWGIGKEGSIPWTSSPDLKLLVARTKRDDAAVMMGRVTWESIGEKPLFGRINAVVSSQSSSKANYYSDNPHVLFKQLEALGLEYCFVLGGVRLYQWAMPLAFSLYISRFDGDYACDRFFPNPALYGYQRVRRQWIDEEEPAFYDELWLRR
ncbi:MAG: dihydrofolate reductase [Bradymonadales bacterium]